MKTSSPTTQISAMREDLVPFFRNELQRAFGGGDTGEPNLVRELSKNLLIDAWHMGASDIHIEPQSKHTRVRVRIDGIVCDVTNITREQGRILVNQFKGMAGLDPTVRFTPMDASAAFDLPDGTLNLRLSLAPSSTGETLAIRLLQSKHLDRSILDLGLDQLDLTELKQWLTQSSGMFLAAGPTGSGKTTTAYSLLHGLRSGSRVIISLEDPVEYQVDGVVQIQINELQNMTFAEGAKAMLRHDPDALMLGEIRDGVSAHTAVQAAITGRVLLSTVHSRDAIGAVTALRNWGVMDREIADALTVVVAQRLVRRLCQACRQETTLSEVDAAWLYSFGLKPAKRAWEPTGCKECKDLGFRGRVGLFEVWRVGEDDYQTILSGTDELSMRKALAQKGHRFLLDDAMAKLQSGLTSIEEVKRIAGGLRPKPKMGLRLRTKGAKVKTLGEARLR